MSADGKAKEEKEEEKDYPQISQMNTDGEKRRRGNGILLSSGTWMSANGKAKEEKEEEKDYPQISQMSAVGKRGRG